jgi:hypothetical protein
MEHLELVIVRFSTDDVGNEEREVVHDIEHKTHTGSAARRKAGRKYLGEMME